MPDQHQLDLSYRPGMISVLTPSYNHAGYIRETIESVLAQNYHPIEHIVVDGGSSDGTREILQEYGQRYPERFRWISEPDHGQSDALNKGIALARGEFIGWQNADDYYYPNTLRAPAVYLTAHPEVAVVYGGCYFVTENGTVLGSWHATPFSYPRLLHDDLIPNQAALMRKSSILAVGGIDAALRYAMDYDLWLKLGMRFQMVFLGGVWGAFRQVATSITNTGLLKNQIECVSIIDRLPDHPSFDGAYLAAARAAFRLWTFNTIIYSLIHDEYATADALLLRAQTAGEVPRATETNHAPTSRARLAQDTLKHLLDWLAVSSDRADLRDGAARFIAFLRRHDLAWTREMSEAIALHYICKALEPRPRHKREALAYLAQAILADHWWLRHRSGKRILIQICLGAQALARTRRALHSVHS